jgi:multidrug efflux pump subunit AcrA (membrane-fusion protein)
VTAAAAFLAGAAFVGAALVGADLVAAQTASPQGSQAQGSRTQVAQVIVVRAKNACFSSMIRVTGFLVARQEAIVSLDVPGLRVTEVLANEGDKVTAGQTLVRLARQSAEGPQPPGGSLTALRAPAAGVVTRSTAAIGATAPAGPAEPLFRIAVDNEIELEAEIPSVHVPELAAGQPARVEIDGNRDLSGRVRLVPAAIDRRTQLGRARLSLDRDPALKLGTFARATIEANRSCGVSVPGSAVLYRTGGASVQVVRDDVVERHTVQVGLRSDTDIEIREGVRDGDLVVANAGSSLRDGDKVRPVVTDKAP